MKKVIEINAREGFGFTQSQICELLEVSRQAYHQSTQQAEQRLYHDEVIIQRVLEIRHKHPKIGVRKLYHILDDEIKNLPITMGRDKLFGLLRENDLLIKPNKRTRKTTNSYHHFRKHPNLIKDWQPRKKDQLWVSDITYIRLSNTFMYLALITDAFSRKIVGFNLSNSLAIEGSLKALNMAILQAKILAGLIHHSDRGIQYCSNLYTQKLLKNNIRISMTESGSPYDNAMAERVNGILKSEYSLDATFATQKILTKTVQQAIWLYNTERPHYSLKYLTPNEVHND